MKSKSAPNTHHGHTESGEGAERISIAVLSDGDAIDGPSGVNVQLWSRAISAFFDLDARGARDLGQRLIAAADAADAVNATAAQALPEAA